MPTTPKDIGKKEFGFLWAVLAVSVLTVALFFTYSLLFLTPSFTRLITENTERTAALIGTHLRTDQFPSGQPFSKEILPKGFDTEIAETLHNFQLMKIKVFAPSGETIYSTETNDIGVINDYDYFHTIVAKGKPFTKIVKKDSNSLEGQRMTIDVVEAYVPAMEGDIFLGAFELYLDITTAKAKLDRLVSHANRLLQIISAGLLLAIIFITSRARANILARRQAESKIIEQTIVLEETNKDLSILNEISAVISRSIDMDRLLPGILDTMTARFSAFSTIARGGILLVVDDKLIPSAHLGPDEKLPCQHHGIATDGCLCGKSVSTGKVIFSTSSSDDSDCTLCRHQEVTAQGRVIIPLIAQDKVVGVLYLYTATEFINASKTNLLQSIGRQIGLAINNVALYHKTRQLALYDQLTGLPNRRYLETKIEEALTAADRYGRPLSIAMIDIDFFKKFNDTMGHAAGDRILSIVGGLLRKESRETDFPARYGGEEFLLVMPETDRCGACLVVERMRKTMERKAGVTISIGVSSYLQEMTMEQLLKTADDALYRAKANGRNRVEWADNIAPCHEAPA